VPCIIVYPAKGTRAKVHPIYSPLITIGSSLKADVPLEDSPLAPLHARLAFDGRKYTLSLLEGRNAFVVGARKVTRAELADGDYIFLEGRLLQFVQEEPREEASVKAPDIIGRLQEFTLLLMEEKDANRLTEELLARIIQVVDADHGFLFVLDKDRVALQARKNLQGPDQDPFSDSVIRRVMETRSGLLLHDAGQEGEFSAARSVVDFRLRSVLCVPMLFRGELLGVIHLGNDSRAGAFNQESLETAQLFATQGAGLVRNALDRQELLATNRRLEETLHEIRFGRIVGSSKGMLEVFRRIERFAPSDFSVLITGETGVGKELIARELHERSRRAAGPFVPLNCSAIPENLFESELFGHVKGAFTGAAQNRKGRFQEANGGTLFLDELGELGQGLQAKLLRAIEERKITRVGSSQEEDVDLRIVAATNRDLARDVGDNRFREDLYYRLKVLTIHVPPLRERPEDLPLIAGYILQRAARTEGLPQTQFSPEALEAMKTHLWPGNVRELQNRIKRALVLADGNRITAADLELEAGLVLPLKEALDTYRATYIRSVLERCGGNRTEAARILGLDPRTIFRYLETERCVEELDTP
jgi:transcriptional regulator with GAF, ATPase, and Fis domain